MGLLEHFSLDTGFLANVDGMSKQGGESPDLSFEHEPAGRWPVHTLSADAAGTTRHLKGDKPGRIGRLSWNPVNNQVTEVVVHPHFQHQGIATELWRKAREINPDLQHSGNYTEEGSGWAGSLGAEAAGRPGRGEETCSCCKGTGEHGDGHECYRCDASGMVEKGCRDPHCPGQPQPRRRHWREPRTAAAEGDDLGGCKEEWQPGEHPHFEYHCLESDESKDAPLWHRSHQQVTVLHRLPREDTGGWEGSTHMERAQEGAPDVYRVRFGDKHEGDVFEDELMTHPRHFFRLDPPPLPRTAAAPAAGRTESVAHMLAHYAPTDFDTWAEVRDNHYWDHPKMRAFVDDVRRNGVRRPIPVDYESDPPRVMNGHTRLLAAEMAGIETVPTRQHHGFMDPDDPDPQGCHPSIEEHEQASPHWQHEASAEPPAAWYHATPEELEPGTVLRPGDEVGKQHMGRGSDSSKLWVSSDPWRASSYGIHIYEVRPHTEPHAPHSGSDEHTTTSAEVLREVPYQEATAISPAYQEGARAYERQRALQAEAAEDTSYRGRWTAPGGEGDDVAAPMHDVENVLPDVYDKPHLYTHDRERDRDAIRQLQRARGNPEAEVDIYRAAPHGVTSINQGDWVSNSAGYARMHAESEGYPDVWPVLHAKAKAKHLFSEGYLTEWGYHGPDIKNAEIHHPGMQATAAAAVLDLYHHTTPENAAAILREQRMTSKERGPDGPEAFFTTDPDPVNSHAGGRGSATVHVRVPASLTRLEDEFPSGAQWLAVPTRHLRPEHFIGPEKTAVVEHFAAAGWTGEMDDRGSNDACPDCGSARFRWKGSTSKKCSDCGTVYGPDLDRNPPASFHESEVPDVLGHFEAAAEPEPAGDEGDGFSYDDWDRAQWPDRLRMLRYRKRSEPQIHRGIAIELPPEVHNLVHDQFQSRDRQAQAIADHLRTQGLGMHWSSGLDAPRHFADYEHKRQPGNTTKVILHARLPDVDHIETRKEKLAEGGTMRYDGPFSSEKEIPLKDGAPVRLTGITWYGYRNKKRDGSVHTWDEPHTAGKIEAAQEPPYVVYHGTHHDSTPGIQERGLERRGDGWTVTTSQEGAGIHAGLGDWTDPKVVEIHVPRDKVSEYLGEPFDATEGTVHALRRSLPAEWVKAVHTAAVQRWYHGTGRPGGFQPGEVIDEAGARREREATGGGIPKIYITRNPQFAAHHARNNAIGRYDYFGQGDAHPRVYEMEPLDGLEEVETGATVKRARVKREVPFELPGGAGYERDKGYYPWGGGDHPGPSVLAHFEASTEEKPVEHLPYMPEPPPGPDLADHIATHHGMKREDLGLYGDDKHWTHWHFSEHQGRAWEYPKTGETPHQHHGPVGTPGEAQWHNMFEPSEHYYWGNIVGERPVGWHPENYGGFRPLAPAEGALVAHFAAAEDELPPDPGTAPIPEGHVRLWHYTPLGNVGSIREHGLQRKYARGDSGTGDLSEPSAGVWASTKRPDELLNSHDSAKGVVEFHAHPDEISGNAESPWHAQVKGGGYDPEKLADWAGGYHHVIMHGDVPTSNIVAVHEPWHAAARYIRDDPQGPASYQWVRDDYAKGGNDHLEPYIRALRVLEAHPKTAAAEPVRYYHGTTEEGLTEVRPMGRRRFYPTEHSGDYAHATTNLHSAWHYWAENAWHETGKRPRVYEVEPTADVEQDPLRDEGGNSRRVSDADVRSKAPWRVVREMPVPEELDHLWGSGWEPEGSEPHTAVRRDDPAEFPLTLYRGEGSHDRPSHYPPGSEETGAWWTSNLDSAHRFAAGQQGDVYQLQVERHEAEPRGLPGYYFVGDPKVRARRTLHTGALQVTAALENPLTGHHEWFHGTQAPHEQLAQGFHDPADMDPERFEQPQEERSGSWSRTLGTHFAAAHDVARRFAEGQYTSPHNDWNEHAEPSVVHARLQVRNPKVYPSEHDLDSEVYEHEWAAGNHPHTHIGEDWDANAESWPTATKLHTTYGDRRIPEGARMLEHMGAAEHPDRSMWLHTHPDRFEIALRHKKRLEEQGHDGVVYGNEYEGSTEHHPAAHTAVIAFHPGQIEVTRRHDASDQTPEPELAGHVAVLDPAAARILPLENPHTRGAEWFHGSPHRFRDFSDEMPDEMFDDDGSGEPEPENHWNTLLGHHFAASHELAHEFAKGDHPSTYYPEGGPQENLVHAHLHLRNPKVYPSEHDMDQEVYEHEWGAGNHISRHLEPELQEMHEAGSDVGPEYDYGDDHERLHPATESDPHYRKQVHPYATGWLTVHPDKFGIAERFRHRLEAAGHDGIVYGNEFEGRKYGKTGRTCAIAFDQGRIGVTQHHLGPQCLSHEDAARQHPPTGQQMLPFHEGAQTEVVAHFTAAGMAHFGATDWDKFYDKIPGEIHRGLFAPQSHHVFSMPASDEDVAHMLISAHQEEQFPADRNRHELFGMHWTSDEGVARDFAHEHEREHGEDDQDPDHDHDEHFEATPVVFHARKPERHEIEHDPRRLGWQNVDDYTGPEQEVPIRHGAPVHITGVSWLKHTGLGPMWHRHDLREPVHLRAVDSDSPDDPNEWNDTRPKPEVVNHFAAAGKPAQLKMFHWQHERQPCPECGYKLGGDEEDQLKHIRHVKGEEYDPVECEHCGHDLNLPREHAENHHEWLTSQDWYTDWDHEGPGDTIHRGIGADLPDEVHAVVHDQSRPVHERAHALMTHLLGSGNVGGASLGNFWSGDPDVSKGYAESYRSRFGQRNEMTPVVFHAHTPDREHFEKDPDTLRDWGVYSYHNAGNREVPLQNQAPVRIKGVSWAPPGHRDAEHPGQQPLDEPGPHHLDQDPAWTHHEVGGEGIRAQATVIGEEAQARTDADLVAHFAAPQGQEVSAHFAAAEAWETGDESDAAGALLRYVAPPKSHGDLMAHMTAEHGVTYSGDKDPALRFLLELHGRFHDGVTADKPPEGSTPHQHEVEPGSHDPVFGSLVAHFEQEAPSFRHDYETYGTAAEGGGYVTRSEMVHGPFYHGGRAKNLRPGDMITPGRKPNPWGDTFDDKGRSIHTYFAHEPETAAEYARETKGHLYEIEPTGDVEYDGSGGDGAWRSRHPLKVIRRIPEAEWDSLPSGHTRPLQHEAAAEMVIAAHVADAAPPAVTPADSIASWSPESPAEVRGLLEDLRGLHAAAAASLETFADRLDDSPVADRLADIIRKMAAACHTAEQDTADMIGRLDAAEGVWEPQPGRAPKA